MARLDAVVAKRVVNALFPAARSSATVRAWGGGALALALAGARNRHGGLWVGGTAYLTKDALIFEPNLANRLAHADPDTLSFVAPLTAMTRVADRFGVLTRIIDIEAGGASFSIRCIGAAAFAAAIRKEAGLT